MSRPFKLGLWLVVAYATVVLSQHFIYRTPDGSSMVWVWGGVMVVGGLVYGWCLGALVGEVETLEQVRQNYHLAKDMWQHTFMQLRDIKMDSERWLDTFAELLDEAYGELAADSTRDGPRHQLLTRIEQALGKDSPCAWETYITPVDLDSDQEDDHA